jgi:hypothetical protein
MNDILYATLEKYNIVKVCTSATMRNSEQVSELLEKDKITILDLSETTYIDSTFLGLIAKYTMKFKNDFNEYLSILNPTNEVLTALKQTGILNFVVILNEDIIVNGTKIEKKDFKSSNIAKHILEMHEILSDLNEDNKKVFSDVVNKMREVVEK